ncbi:RNA polymerase sigma-70 factor [Spirosoma daeguense]
MYTEPFSKTQEADLLKCLQQGRADAFEKLYSGYKRPVLFFIQKFLKSDDEAEEILHDVFLKVWQNREQLDPGIGVGGYLHTLARNLVLNQIKQKATANKLNQEWGRRTNVHSNTVEDQYITTEYEQLAHNAIGQLPPRRQEVYQLCSGEGKSYDEVGKQLGISRDAVKDHMVHARRFLTHFLRRYADLTLIGIPVGATLLKFFLTELP